MSYVDADHKTRRAIAGLLSIAHLRGDAHIVSCLGTIEILCSLFNLDFDFQSDILVISKGHASLALYASLVEYNQISKEEFLSFRTEKSQIGVHVSGKMGNLSRLSSGSLGHGIGFASGIALSKKMRNEEGNVYVVVGDGELNEGSNYEALQIASLNQLSNLRILVDHNKVQSVATYEEVSGQLSLEQKLKAFGCETYSIDDMRNLNGILKESLALEGKPLAIVCDTTTRSLVPSMQRKVVWHYRKPSLEDLKVVFDELNLHEIAADYAKLVNL